MLLAEPAAETNADDAGVANVRANARTSADQYIFENFAPTLDDLILAE